MKDKSTENSNKSNFKFLSDEAVREIENDRLKHPSIAEALKTIVVNCPLPFTIGLFGKWGTGKSSIANFLKSKLVECQEKIVVVDFDVWKYAEDSLRRYFLINLVTKLKEQKSLKDKYELDERVESSTSRSFEGALKISWAKVARFWRAIAIFLVVIIFGGCMINYISPSFSQIYFAIFISLGFMTSAILFLFQIGSDIFTTETKTLSQERLKDAHEFEKEFSKIIDNTKTERILIIIDNLDRCTHSKAVEVLSIIKTFLEPKGKKCIFLVQCDEEAIKKHLESVYIKNENAKPKKDFFDADEFLRKFFNTSIKIPPFIDADLEEYTKELLHETGVEIFDNNADLVSIITQAFRENPRQIKQFINTLLSYYLLALERESGNDPVIMLSGVITGNPAFLAKFLIIQQEWPKFYKKIVKKPKSIENYTSMEDELQIFMMGTNIIKTDNLRAFIYLKQSARKLALPGGASDNLEIAFEDNKGDEAIEILKDVKGKETKDSEITAFITELIQENKDANQNLVNIINLTARSQKELGLDIQTTFSEKVAEVITNNLLDHLPSLTLDFVFFVIEKSRPAFRESIISQYISILGWAKDTKAIGQITNYSKFILDLIGCINSNRDLFILKKAEMTKVLTDAYFDNIDALILFGKNEKAIEDFINSELLIKLIGSITDLDFTTKHSTGESLFNIKLNFLSTCKKVLNTAVVEAILEKLNTLLTAQNKTPETPEKKVTIKLIVEKTESILKEFLKEDFINSELLIKLIGSITDLDFTTKHSTGESLFNIKLNCLSTCKKVINTAVVEAILEKLNTLLIAQNKIPETPERKLTIKLIVEKTESILKEFSAEINDSQKADMFTSTLVQSSTNAKDFLQKSIFLPVFFYLSNIAGANGKSSIKQQIQFFIKGTDISIIESFFESKDVKFQQDFFQVIKADIEERAMQDKKYLDFIWRFEDGDNRNIILSKLIDSSNYVFALEKLDEENYKISDKKGIVDLLLAKTQSLSPVEKARIYGVVNEMECGKDKNLREKYIIQLKGMVINQNTASQEIAFNAYSGAFNFLPYSVKLTFTVDIIDWLKDVDPVNINHKFALKIALLYWDKISVTHKDILSTIIFDRIIAKTKIVDEINMAFDIIRSAKPSYIKYKPHFDITLSRAETEQDATIKEAIKTGLQELGQNQAKPEDPFWIKVDQL